MEKTVSIFNKEGAIPCPPSATLQAIAGGANRTFG